MKKWSLNLKILAVLGIFVVASLLISGMGIMKMQELHQTITQLINGPVTRADDARSLSQLFTVQNLNEKNFILEDSKDGMEEVFKKMAERHDQLHKKLEETYEISTEAGKEDLKAFKDVYEKWWVSTQQIQKLSMAGDNKAAFEISRTTNRQLRYKGEEIMDKIIGRNQKVMTDENTRAAAEYAHARMMMLITSTCAILFGLALATIVLKAVNRAIDQVIAHLTDNSHQVTSAARQISSSSEELSQAATEQAAALQETATAIEQMSSMIQKSADNAQHTSDASISNRQTALQGKEAVQNMIQAITEINNSNLRIAEIVNVITEIGNKTKVINDIVFQTKLLSFNASVEAARAGEHGKGFAVVAEEVGKLAQMSGNSAKQITAMLDESISKVENLVRESKEKVDVGTHVARQCGDILEQIESNANSTAAVVSEIATACREQAQGVQEITRAMNQLDQVTQTNAATSEEAAGAAEELSAQADSLQNVIGVLVETIKGSDHRDNRPVIVHPYPTSAATGAGATRKPVMPKPAPVTAQAAPKVLDYNGPVPSADDPRFGAA